MDGIKMKVTISDTAVTKLADILKGSSFKIPALRLTFQGHG